MNNKVGGLRSLLALGIFGAVLFQSPEMLFGLANVFQVKSSGNPTVTCGKVGRSWLSGAMAKSGGRRYFVPYKTTIATLKASKKRASAAKKIKIQAKIDALKALMLERNPICKSSAPTSSGGSPTPNPTLPPSGGGTPVPTLQPSACGAGPKFGIPSGITGLASAGRSTWNASCLSCHGNSKKGSSYSTIKNSAGQPSMIGVKSLLGNNQTAANIAAYLNNCP